MRTALTIAGSDSSGGAGIQGDLKTFAALGVYGTSAVTAITAQNTTGILALEPVSADLVIAQIEAIAGDIELHAVKTGMLANAAIVEAVAAAVEELELPNVIVDPVLGSTSGTALLDRDGVQMLISDLLPRARVVTPNIPEAEALSGRRIHSGDDAREAARRIHALGPSAVVITGGHAPTANDGRESTVVDLLFDGREFIEFRTVRIAGPNTHGTGCAFASALAAYLARGDGLPQAVEQAQRFVAGAIGAGIAIGRTGGGHGPLHHFWGGILKV
jgi:hydroxymethylpyrimidine/phosphomethylpyrimidine kinase